MKFPIQTFICLFVFVTLSSNSIAQQCSATAGYQDFNVGGNKNGDSLALPSIDETTDLFINVDGVETKIYLTFLDRTYSYSELASVFNSKIPNITASVVGGNLRIQSNTIGSNSKVIMSRFAEEESDFRIYLQGYQGLSAPVFGTGSNTDCTVVTPLSPQLAAPPTPSPTIDSVRVLPANFDVTSSGQAVYNIPILTGPGSAGFAPKVSLSYNSDGGNGSLGLGWSLNAGGSISRCRQTEGQDKSFAPIAWNQEDRFCLNGERLLVSAGYTYGALNSQYKTEIDSFARITAVGGAVGQPEYFKVERKDGRIDYYGKNDGGAESRHKLASDKILSWPLTQSEDSAGNKIIYTYADDEDLGVQRPITSISYGFDSNGSTAAYRIYFNWESNSEEISGYISGYKYRNIYRLESIESHNLLQPSLLRMYKLLYNQDSAEFPWDKVSRLFSIQECATTYICGTPTKFDWLLPEIGGFISNLTPLITLASPYRTHVFGDINGDGLQDLVWMQTGDSTIRYAFASVDDIGRISYSPQNFENNQIISASSYLDTPAELSFIDYNGDGRKDLVVHQHPNPASIRIFLSKPQANGGWLLAGTPVQTLSGSSLGFTTSFTDLNGDGLEDLVGLDTLKFRYLRSATGLDVERNITVIPPSGSLQSCYQTIGHPIVRLRPETGDFNGDGRTDFIAAVKVCTASGSARYEFHLYTSHIGATGNLELRYFDVLTDKYADTLSNLWGSSDRIAGRINVVDLNADGLSDVIFSLNQSYYSGGCQPGSCNLDNGNYITDGMSRYKFSTGKQLSAETQIGNFDRKLTSFTDFNGDGHPDILIAPPDFIGQPGKTNIRYWNSKTNTFDSTTTTLQMPYAPTVDSVIYQDINGDGAPDYFFIGADSGPRRHELHAMLNYTKDKVSNRIRLITNGLGHKTQITYQPLAKTTHYSRIQGVKSNAYENVCVNVEVGQTCWDRQVAFTNSTDFYNFVNNPFNELSSTEQPLNSPPLSAVFDISGSTAIVTGIKQDAPQADAYNPTQINTNATRDTVYYYEQLRAQAAGRGWLGFKKTIKIDGGTGLRNVSIYRQDWPFAGQIRTSETYTQSGHLLDKTENTWGFVNCHDLLGTPNPGCVSNMRTQASTYGTSMLICV